ncbi:hypothetical protein QFZ94_001878 [Paraburkholderia sp. JPY465]
MIEDALGGYSNYLNCLPPQGKCKVFPAKKKLGRLSRGMLS